MGGDHHDAVYEEVSLSDMDWDEEEEAYFYTCPCGDKFVITLDELWDGEDIAHCPSCSLILRVLYEEEDLPELDEEYEEEEADSPREEEEEADVQGQNNENPVEDSSSSRCSSSSKDSSSGADKGNDFNDEAASAKLESIFQQSSSSNRNDGTAVETSNAAEVEELTKCVNQSSIVED